MSQPQPEIIVNELGQHSDEISVDFESSAVVYSPKPDGGNFSRIKKDPTKVTTTPWMPWGDDNLKPLSMADDITNTGVLSAGIHSKVRMAVGKGILPFYLTGTDSEGNETLEACQEKEIISFLERNRNYLYSYSNIYNMIAYGFSATQGLLSDDKKQINRIKAVDIFSARLGVKNNKNFIDKLYLCGDWANAGTSYDNTKMSELPILEEGYELEALINGISGHEFVMLHRILLNGTQYYPQPLWEAAKEWVKHSRSIPKMKNAINKNMMSIKYVVLIDASYWARNYKDWGKKSEKEQETTIKNKRDEINKFLTGELNAGKTIVSGKFIDPATKAPIEEIEIKVIDDKWKDGKWLPDSAAADKQILFAMFFNPAIWGGNLLGDGASGGAGSGSDIREAFLVQIMLMHAERMLNLEIFNLIKHFNGWTRFETDKKTLVFRYPNYILTTLDTGKSTKPITN